MADYYPEPDTWERRPPEDHGMDSERLEAAIGYAIEHESPIPQDLSDHERIHAERTLGHSERRYGDEEHYAKVIGPLPRRRGDPAGVIVKDGYIVGEWGDPARVDMANSITKSYLSTVAGVAYDRGLIDDVDDRVKEYVWDGGFDYSHNRAIEWEHLLQQTSEWEGTLFDKPDEVDRKEGRERELREPGAFWEYNNVRVNRLSLALLRVFEKPLPMVIEESVLGPIGASDSWQWHGYDNSDVLVDGRTGGQMMKSVACGGHWGGGVWTDSLDLARYGYLHLRNGRWAGRQLVSEEWLEKTLTPCELNRNYGYLWWLNTDGALWPSAPDTSFAAIGRGYNVVWVDPEDDLVVVMRWLGRDEAGADAKYPYQDGVIERVLAAVE